MNLLQHQALTPRIPRAFLFRMKLEVSVARQIMRLVDASGNTLRSWRISTSRYGLGSEPGSNHTPLGRFRVARKIGDGAPLRTIFKSREVVGVWDGGDAPEDYVLTRILWLEGLDPHNANTFDRYIYIHGTNQETRIGTPASHGCVRMTNADVVEVYDLVPEGTLVEIGDVPGGDAIPLPLSPPASDLV